MRLLIGECHSQSTFDDNSSLVQVMAWCQATSHHLNQCWPSFMTPHGITWPQWVQCISSERACHLTATAGATILGVLSPLSSYCSSFRQNGSHFADSIFKCIFFNENFWIPIKISLKFVPKGPINNILVLVQIMAWRWPGDKPLPEPMMISSRTYIHVCITLPQWIKDHVLVDVIYWYLILK